MLLPAGNGQILASRDESAGMREADVTSRTGRTGVSAGRSQAPGSGLVRYAAPASSGSSASSGGSR
jgi:hypothetical protein